jgi:F-type H+-transporting ATPase subunit a
MEHEIWITALLNNALAGPANALLDTVGLKHDPSHPWSNWMAIEVLVALILLVFFAVLRARLSVDKPGKAQHVLEVIYEFLGAQAEEIIGHDAKKFRVYFGTLFFFILALNLIGLIPGLESPTMFPMVPFGLALCTVVFYNWQGLRSNGVGYLKQFFGPMVWLAPLMIPIEIISHLARPLSLTVRLYANMLAGEQVFLAFLGLTKLFIPAIFIGLHLFVSFLQAYIFTLLSMIYVGSAVSHEH